MATFDLKELVRPNIFSLDPYRCARDDYDSGVLLDANENSFGSSVEFNEFEELERYPCPYQQDLKGKIAQYRGTQKENIFLGVGSDEAIDILIRIFCVPGKEAILILPPTYGMYKVSAAVNDVRVISAPLTKDFQIDMIQTESKLKEHPEIKIIFICSPNNPTANDIHSADIEKILKENPNKIVVVDEAYIDFTQNQSFVSSVQNFKNLIVLQTLSKSFGLAGIRLGMAIGNPEIIHIMNKVKAPYNINKMTSKIALEAFNEENLNKMKEKVVNIEQEKLRIIEALGKIEQVKKIYPSSANFILFQISNSFSIYKKLAELGVVIRYRGNEIHCEDCLRMSIGTPSQNTLFLEKLQETLSL